MSAQCVFCEIVAGRSPAKVEVEWSDAIAIRPLNPVAPGHLLVIPKVHVADALTDPVTSAAVMWRAAELAHAPCNIITSCGIEATQSVFHLHLHIVPRTSGDGMRLPWTDQAALPEPRIDDLVLAFYAGVRWDQLTNEQRERFGTYQAWRGGGTER